MASDSKQGSDLMWVLMVFVVLFALWLFRGQSKKIVESVSPFNSVSENKEKSSDSGREKTEAEAETVLQKSSESIFAGQVTLGIGTAKSANVANKEYITITANRRNKESIDISGWRLKNNPNAISYNSDGSVSKRRALDIKLPSTGIKLYNPYASSFKKSAILLSPGKKAIILSGGIPSVAGTSFKDNFQVNICMGYLQDLTDYKFVPSFSSKCPKDDDLPGSDYLNEDCLKYLKRRSSCHQPDFSDDKNYGTCVDRNCKLNSYCLAFLKKNFSYESCFNLHSHDEDFLTGEWRLFLNQAWELWPKSKEIIYLYDSKGKLVDQLEY